MKRSTVYFFILISLIALLAACTTKFDEFPEGAKKALERMEELYALVQNNE